MPRKRETQSGASALAVASTAGVRYGEGQQYSQLQSNLPSPNNRADSAPPAGTSTAAPTSPGVPPSLPPEAAAAAYTRPTMPLPEPGLLLAPTNRPTEPVTTGLRLGPGAGPSALSIDTMESPTGKLMRDLSRITGRQAFADLARKSGL